MKTIADLRAYCESRFPVGEPTDRMLSVTGEPDKPKPKSKS